MTTVSFMQETLEGGLKHISKAVASKSTLPVLSNVLISVDNGIATLLATNLEIAITGRVKCQSHGSFAFTLPYRLLSDYVAAMPAERVDITWDAETATATVECSGSKANIKGIEASEFPTVNITADESVSAVVQIPGDVLDSILTYTVFAAATEESRPILTGLKFEMGSDSNPAGERELRVFAADGFRLSTVSYALSADAVIQPQLAIEAIIPSKGLSALRALIADEDTVTFYLTHNQAIFEAGWWQIAIQLLEGNFPNVATIIPNETITDAVFGVASLASATRTANLFSRDAANIVEYTFTAAGVEIAATSQEMGDHTNSVALMDFQGEEITIAFNGKYLAEYLVTLAGTSGVLRLNSPAQPGLFLCNHLNYQHVIMPMHISR